MTTRLPIERDIEIRNRLDEIRELLYQDKVLFDDMCWSYTTMKALLFDIYLLEKKLKDVKTHGARGQPT